MKSWCVILVWCVFKAPYLSRSCQVVDIPLTSELLTRKSGRKGKKIYKNLLNVTFNISVFILCFHITVEQLPTIVTYTTGPIIALPFDPTVKIKCKAKGNPTPE